MKDCMFHYATRHRIIANTDLITLDQAKELFKKNQDDFLARPLDEDSEMVIWIDCKNNGHYGDTLYHWYADDFRVIDGVPYKRV